MTEPAGKDELGFSLWMRVIIFDFGVPIVFAVFTYICARRAVVSKFVIVSFSAYLYGVLMLTSTVMHLLITMNDEERGWYKIMIMASFMITESFNTFLVLVYRYAAKDYICMTSGLY